MIKVIRNEERFHFESDWLSTYWHFSFDRYYDPNNMGFGPLRVFNEDVVQPSTGFPLHGHSEMEIVTYVIDGELEHKDSTGGAGGIGPGEVQRMSAGTGIRHSEYNASPDTPVHLLQIWVLPSEKGLAPSYEQLRFTKEQREGRLLPVASGQDMPGVVKVHQDTTFYVSAVRPEDRIVHRLAPGRRAYLFVIAGELEMNGQALAKGDQARIEDESELSFAASTPSEILLIDLP
ncbi:MAG TPA: pirin family protein [Blastocatellia bacterium]|jgi:redox-sensitive bicupin YhaK (pirin superfamily)|nr:pirin family protein [Blastocatellia bacterium]